MSWIGDEYPVESAQAFGGGSDYHYPWWDANEETTANRTVRCEGKIPTYHALTAIICGMFLIFGIVYSLFGYRCFKAVMFLTGFIFASAVVYLICLSENLLPQLGNAGVSLGAGIMFGLITMLVQYVGLFMTGLHTGLFLGVATIAAASPWWDPPSIWAVVGILLASGLLLAILTLYFQKGLTIVGTAVSGGAIMFSTLDYFIEEFLMIYWFQDRLTSTESDQPCWFSWLLLAVWPFMVLVGILTQWRITAKGTYHQQMMPPTKSGNLNLQRLRTREARAEMRQKKYRYLYQVRTAHGDIISQVNMGVTGTSPADGSGEYVQSLQRKTFPTNENGTLQSDSTHTTMLPPDHTQLAPLTESEEEGLAPSGSGRHIPARLKSTPGLSESNYEFSSSNLHPTPPPSPASPERDVEAPPPVRSGRRSYHD